VAQNTSSIAQVGTITIAGQTFTVIQTGVPCSYTLSVGGSRAAPGGASGSVSVQAPDGCGWIATSNAGWITVTGGASGSGNGMVSYAVAANTDVSTRRP
jgi:hypothetical protein